MDSSLISVTSSVRTSLRHHLRWLPLLAVSLLLTLPGFAISWFPFGPDGGDARAFAADPHDHDHLYLGTLNGWIYDSHDGGKSWKRLARVGKRDDLALDNIVVDPADSRHIIVGAWVLGSADGGLFTSSDGGATWTSNSEMQHQSIRALAIAPSDGKIMIAGTLQGVFRSTDSGTHWKLISPPGSTEIHEVESIAIDPTDPQIIYAGTWHLPWKTTDGGASWNNIKQGIIEDSDVFSIIVDPKQPRVVYASACSGIYKSDNAGERFTKVQGIPATARRTRVLMQDPEHLETVFAGTTEGLFRTDDAGAVWTRTTSDDVIVNDVYVDPTNSKRVLMATDRGGVLASNDGGVSFNESNSGFSARQITSLTSNIHHQSDIFIGVANDKQWGGAFLSNNGGLTWRQRSDGLDGHDVLSLGEAANGTIVAGTEHGLFLYDPAQQVWKRSGDLSRVAAEKPLVRKGAHAVAARKPAAPPARVPTGGSIEAGILALERVRDQLYAVTTDGIFAADDPAKGWWRVTGPSDEPWRYLASAQSTALLASLRSMTLSLDSGRTWHAIAMPPSLVQVGAIAVDDSGELWAGGREGIFFSTDNGASWSTLKNLYVSDVNNIFFDAKGQRLLFTANGSTTMAFSIHLPDKSVKYWETGWNLRFLRPVGDYLVGATMFDGIVVQPRMVNSAEVGSH